MATPICFTCSAKSSIVKLQENPGIDSSLSIVPPVCPKPFPESFAIGIPAAASNGIRVIVTLSPTPPVECLSTILFVKCPKSILSPELIIASVK